MMQTKHFFNEPNKLVLNALESLTYTNPGLALDRENRIVYRRPTEDKTPKVSIVSGGGSGHEPAFAGYVGKGMLTASVAGTVFASPSAEQIRRAVLQRVDARRGVLVICENYTGDVLNFGMATEKAKAAGIDANFFAVDDDVGVGRTKGGKVGRRGICGGILVLKLVGALAEAGASLDEVYNFAKVATENIVSLGASLERVHVPGRPAPSEDETIPVGEIEVGMGIHNEAGSHRIKAEPEELVGAMLKQMLDKDDAERAYLDYAKDKDQFVLLVNNLGGLSVLELGAITAEACNQLGSNWGIKPVRAIQGTFLTSLNGLGFSITLMKVVNTGLPSGVTMLNLLDIPTEAVGWSSSVSTTTWERQDWEDFCKDDSAAEEVKPCYLTVDPAQFKKVLSAGLDAAILAEPEVTRFDTVVGDGDCGTGLKRGAEAVYTYLNSPNYGSNELVTILNSITEIIEVTMDGTSGALFAIFLNALTGGLRGTDSSTSPTPTTMEKNWAPALKASMEALSKYTPAQKGDRTFIDALAPFVEVLSQKTDLDAAAQAAIESADASKHLRPGLGRAVYVGGEEKWLGKIPDPGAFGLAQFMQGIAKGAATN